MLAGKYTSEELKDRLIHWIRYIGEKKKDSWPCNLPVSVVDCDGKKLQVTLCLKTDKTMENPWGVTHGGVLASALDWAMGATARTALDQNDAPTVSLQIDYLRPVPLGEEMIIKVSVDHAGKTLAHLEAKGYVAGECCVSASGHYFMRNIPLVIPSINDTEKQ